MSEDSFTEVSTESWGSRIGNSIKGILFGLFLFVVAFPLLFWNEGRAVKEYKTLQEGKGAVVSISAERINPANEGKLIHVNGRAVTDETLIDEAFGVSVNALKLARTVEMYQWQEYESSKTRKKVGGGTETVTTYNYKKTWSERLISSSDFKKPQGHENPAAMPYKSREIVADTITIGEFTIPKPLVGKINTFTPLSRQELGEIPEDLQDTLTSFEEGYYMGNDPANPEIGNMRISFTAVKPTDVSLIAKQNNNSFESYQTQAGGSISMLQVGIHSPESMFQRAEKHNMILSWLLRFGGFFIMLIGLTMILKPLSVLADVLPILGDLVGIGTGIVASLVAGILSLIIIAIAWIYYRPVLGMVLIGVSIGLTVAFGIMKSKYKAKVSLQRRPAEVPQASPV